MAARRRSRPGRQGGMALLVVLLILSVMVIIASNMSGRLQLELRRTSNLTAGKQAWWYAMSAEALVIKVLNQDFKDDPDVVRTGRARMLSFRWMTVLCPDGCGICNPVSTSTA